MTRVETSVLIDRPLEDVFAFIANVENNPVWQTGMQEAEITSEGPIGVGSTYSQLAKFLGRPVESTFEIVEYEDNHKIKGRSTSGSFPITFTRTAVSTPEGTKVSALIEGDASGFFRLAEPLLNRMVQRQVKADYSKLKTLLESGAPEIP
jgi:uncharacterized membrane protein